MEDLWICAILHLLVGHVLCVPGLAESVCTQNQELHLHVVSRLLQPGLT